MTCSFTAVGIHERTEEQFRGPLPVFPTPLRRRLTHHFFNPPAHQFAMEPLGLRIGLAGLFTASLEVLDRISVAKSYSEGYDLFVTKIEIERLRLFLWGQAVGISDGMGARHELLHDPVVRKHVHELLTWEAHFFESSDLRKQQI